MNAILVDKLAALPLFAGASAESLQALVAQACERHWPAGTALIRQGDPATHVYVLLDGRLRTVLDGRDGAGGALTRLAPGALFGEIGVLTGGTREATVVADTDVVVLEIPGTGFEHLLEQEEAIARRVARQAGRRLREAQLARQLARLFPDVNERIQTAVRQAVDWVELRPGEHLVDQGDPADAAYIVVSGRLQAIADDTGGDARVMAETGPGELVGEMALLEGGVRTATLVAIRTTEVARLGRARLLTALRRHPESLLGIIRTALRRASSARAPRGAVERRSIVLVALHPTVDSAALAAGLLEAMRRAGPATLLRLCDAADIFGNRRMLQGLPDGPAAARLAQWLQEQEDRHGTLLLLADQRNMGWNALLLRQADHVVLVGDATRSPEPTTIEAELDRANPAAEWSTGTPALRRSLVLLHPAERIAPPRGTARWLALRVADGCHHVRHGHPRDLARLARILTGRPVSLVFSGGGARGYAHLGAVRALEEAGVPVDIVGGTSIGAVMAALMAFDTGVEEQANRAAYLLRKTLDWTLPLASLVKGGRMAALAEQATEGRDIEDMWLPWFAVSANLTRSQVAVHRRGSITRALRASVAIPGIVPPVVYDGELHIDGGVLDNLPVEPMRRINPHGPLIAVDVALNEGPRVDADYGLSVSGWALLAQRLLPGAKPPQVPGIASTLVQSMIAGSSRSRDAVVARGLADLYLDLRLPQCGMLEFDAPERIIAAGYEAAAPRVREWADTLPAALRGG
ncbi:MAG: cyclic nucleotide-binding domain-containing protein [Ectothiorhodospiraceae bacterium]|nr:cyclic nucleotide-binding domain-containing protein [Ectothiorhodospiraceae bacterium]